MKPKGAVLTLLLIVALPLGPQASAAITIDQEPHHHLAFRNDYIEIHQIILPPGEAFKLHRHDMDEIAITITGADSIGESLGKPPVHSTSKAGRVSYAPAPRVHLVRNIGTTTPHNLAATLLHPQADLRNLCATPRPDQPANCPTATTISNASYAIQRQFETDQTHASLIRVSPSQAAPIEAASRDELVVAIDEVVMALAAGKAPGRVLHAGDFVWVGRGQSPTVVKNYGGKEGRLATLEFKRI